MIDTSFIRIDAAWAAAHALYLLDALRPRRVIVHRHDDSGMEYFYAYERSEVTPLLQARPTSTVFEALNLHEWKASPTSSQAASSTAADTVIIADGRIVGVYSPTIEVMRSIEVRGKTPNLVDNVVDKFRTIATPRGLTATLPAELVVGSDGQLNVRIVKEIVAGVVQFAGSDGDKIAIFVQASGAIALVGEPDATFVLGTVIEPSASFTVRGQKVGEGVAKIYAFLNGQRVAELSLTTRVVAAATASPGKIEGDAAFHAPEPTPELSLLIIEDKTARSYRMLVNAADPALQLNFAKFGPITLDDDVDAFFATFFADIESILAADGDSPDAKADRLAAKGTYLMDKIMPRELRDKLWELRPHIKAIQIQSDEPWVPWELCKLSGAVDGKIVEAGFLAEEFIVTRWFMGVPQRPTVTLKTIGLVVPSDSGLAAAGAEASFIKSLEGDGRTVTEITARSVELRTALASAKYDAIHFTGHGSAVTDNADRSNIRLEEKRTFCPEDLAGRVANLGIPHPLVFLNACQIGRGGTVLGGMAGWPQAFVRAGAGAFIGTYWKVGDGKASGFAQTFYCGLLRGLTIGDAAHAARAAARSAMDPTWLSYVVYAYPGARVAS